MLDEKKTLVAQGYTFPLYWIRYGPDTDVQIEGVIEKVGREDRERRLMNHIDWVCSDKFVPIREEYFHCMFDLISVEDGPVISGDPRRPDEKRRSKYSL